MGWLGDSSADFCIWAPEMYKEMAGASITDVLTITEHLGSFSLASLWFRLFSGILQHTPYCLSHWCIACWCPTSFHLSQHVLVFSFVCLPFNFFKTWQFNFVFFATPFFFYLLPHLFHGLSAFRTLSSSCSIGDFTSAFSLQAAYRKSFCPYGGLLPMFGLVLAVPSVFL